MDIVYYILSMFLIQMTLIWSLLGVQYAISLAIIVPIVGLVLYLSFRELVLLIQDQNKVGVSDKIVLITGCDTGFGFALAKSISKKGILVFAGVLNISCEGAETLRTMPGVRVLKLDVTKEDEVESVHDVMEKELAKNERKLWAVVNNAGIVHSRLLEFVPIPEVQRQLEVNTIGVLRVSQKFIPFLRGHGRIINITSIGGTVAYPMNGSYCMTKFATEALSKSFRLELNPFGIAVITIRPLGYRTQIFLNATRDFCKLEEEKAYGEKFVTSLKHRYLKSMKNMTENIQEVTDTIESAILNKSFQYNYYPGRMNRVKVLCMAMLPESHVVGSGFYGMVPRAGMD